MTPQAQTFVAAIRAADAALTLRAAIARASRVDPKVQITRNARAASFHFTDGTAARVQFGRRNGVIFAYTLTRKSVS